MEEDVLIALGDQPVASVDDLHKRLTELPIDVPANVTILRDGRRLERMVLPTQFPDPSSGNRLKPCSPRQPPASGGGAGTSSSPGREAAHGD